MSPPHILGTLHVSHTRGLPSGGVLLDEGVHNYLTFLNMSLMFTLGICEHRQLVRVGVGKILYYKVLFTCRNRGLVVCSNMEFESNNYSFN